MGFFSFFKKDKNTFVKRQSFMNSLETVAQHVNCPYIAMPGVANEDVFDEMGVRFSNSTFIIFHGNNMGYTDILVCFDENDNVVAAKVGNPSEAFISTLNKLRMLYGAKIKSYKQPKFESNKLIIILA